MNEKLTAAELARLQELVAVPRIVFDLIQVALAAGAGFLQELETTEAGELATEMDRIGALLAEMTGSPVPPRGVRKPSEDPQSPQESPR